MARGAVVPWRSHARPGHGEVTLERPQPGRRSSGGGVRRKSHGESCARRRLSCVGVRWVAIRNLGHSKLPLGRKRLNFGEMRVMDRVGCGPRFEGGWCDGSISLVPKSAMQKTQTRVTKVSPTNPNRRTRWLVRGWIQ
jgi:hypothetical protein